MGLEIPHEVADGIVLASLQEHVGFLKEHIRRSEEEGAWIHADDYKNHKLHLIPAFETLIQYYGG